PSLRGRISKINGVEADKADIAPEVQWAIRGDRVLSFADEPPPESPVVAGRWWQPGHEGAAQVSITEDLARGMNLNPGDRLSVSIMGQEVEATVAAIRDVNWRNYRMNFALIFSPGALREFPHSYMATLRADDESAES